MEETAPGETSTELKNEQEEPAHKQPENDPFAYLEKTGFTSEKFKIEIRNLPKYYGIGVS